MPTLTRIQPAPITTNGATCPEGAEDRSTGSRWARDGRARIHAERDADTDRLFAALENAGGPDTAEGRRIVTAIVDLHLELCDGMARRYCNRGIDREDLLQVARLALLKAIRRYRPGTGASFAGFAVPTVSGELKRHFRDHGWVVRPSRRVQELRISVRRKQELLTHELGRTPTRDELAETLGVDVKELGEAEGAGSSFRPLSLDVPNESGEPTRVVDAVCTSDPELDLLCDRLDLARVLASLPPRTRQVLHLRLVEERTQGEIAAELGVTQMQVSRLLSRTFRQLREQLSQEPSDDSALAS